MDTTYPLVTAVLFGAVVAAVELLIVGWSSWRPWLAKAFVYACFCYVIVFGVVRL